MKKRIFLLPLLLLLIVGCATTRDLKRVQNKLDQKIDNKIAETDEKLAALTTENAAVRGDMEKNIESIKVLQKKLAENGADIRDNLRQLKGQIEDLRKDLAALSARANRKDEEYKDLKEKLGNALNEAVFKINFIENYLEIGKKENPTEATEITEKSDKLNDLSKGKPSSDKELAYASAYELFKAGKFDKAREAFYNFLKQYPDTEYSDNAQFRIAECFYFEKKYENAILEYERVAKKYPEGDKVPYALLKQGFAFLKLGDKKSAKLVLQRVIKDYPNTNQAKTAKSQLLKIK